MAYRESAKEPANRFDAEMAKCTDEELLAILNGPAADREPEALEAARLELEVRDLTRDEQRELVERFEEAREARVPIEPAKVAIALAAGVVAGMKRARRSDLFAAERCRGLACLPSTSDPAPSTRG